MKRTWKNYLVLALLPAILLFSAGCEKDYIDVNSEYYEDGGVGTSQNTGSLVFRVNVKGAFTDFDRAEFRIFPSGRVRTLDRTGRHDIAFYDLEPGFYDYTIEEWLWNSGVSIGGGFTFGTGGFSTSATTFFGPGGYDRDFLSGGADIRAGQTLFININF